MLLIPLLGVVLVTLQAAPEPARRGASAGPADATLSGPCAAAPQEDKDDQRLAALLRSRLAEHQRHLSHATLDAIRIDVHDGLVRLQGDVPSALDRFLVGIPASSVDGVRAVLNELTVTGDGPVPGHPA